MGTLPEPILGIPVRLEQIDGLAPNNAKPPWLWLKPPAGTEFEQVRSLLDQCELDTVCQVAQCPNQWECFSSRVATFLIMGSHCTRNCRFCAVEPGAPGPLDPEEPVRVAEATRFLGLRYVVVTSVTRDDLADGGARFFAKTIRAIREKNPLTLVEVLIPDFKGNAEALEVVVAAAPDVLNHNIETVPRLYPSVRPGAVYERSLDLLGRAKSRCASSVAVKSGLMLGLGEFPHEIRRTLEDLLNAGCSMLTLGQYLQPSEQQIPVERYVPPEEFDYWKRVANEMGFPRVASSPLVRSSYHAEDLFRGPTGT